MTGELNREVPAHFFGGMEYIKAKSAILIARDFLGSHQSSKGYHFIFGRVVFLVSTVGIDPPVRSRPRKERPTETVLANPDT